LLHWDGASWSPSPGFVPDPYERVSNAALAAISPTDAIVATSQGCQRWDASSWQATACGVLGGRGIFALSSNDVWVVGFDRSPPGGATAYRAHWDGSTWTTTVVADERFGSIGGTGPSDIWIDGKVHYDGSTWTEVNCGPEFTSMSVSDNGAIMGVNYLGIEYFSGDDGWPFLARTYTQLQAIGGRVPTDVWAVGGSGEVLRYDGSGWSGQQFSLPQSVSLRDAFGSSSSDIWGVPYGTGLVHFDGRAWTSSAIPAEILAGFSRTPSDAVATDTNLGAWHWNGTTWDRITLPIFEGNRISKFWGTAPDDVWAVGGRWPWYGAIYHWDGDAWQRIYSRGGVGYANSVGGSGRDDVWFSLSGDNPDSAVLHWDGTAVSYVTTLDSVHAIAATAPNDVWFIQHNGTLLHYDGVSWTPDDVSAPPFSLWSVAGAGTFFFTGAGAIFQHP
jgi:hypothetical protein